MEKYINALKKRDEQAFEYIYHQTKDAVYSIILAIIKDKQLSEDIMQDTYIEMVSSINRYNPKYKFKNWLLTIARNKAIDTYRKRKREFLVDIDENENVFPDKKNDMDNQITADYLLSLLDTEEREVVMLYIVDGMKHKEIAEVLDKPIGTVLWIYNKAIKKLQSIEGGKQDE